MEGCVRSNLWFEIFSPSVGIELSNPGSLNPLFRLKGRKIRLSWTKLFPLPLDTNVFPVMMDLTQESKLLENIAVYPITSL